MQARGKAALIAAGAKANEGARTLGDQPEQPDPAAEMKARASIMDAVDTKRHGLKLEAVKIAADSHNQALDRQAEAHSDAIDLAKEIMGHQADAALAARETPKLEKEIEG